MRTARGLFRTLALAIIVMSAALADGQGGGPNIQLTGVNAQLNVIFQTGPKGTQKASPVAVSSSGPLALPPGLLSPDKPHTKMIVYQCPDGVYIVADGSPNPCPDHHGRLGAFWWDTGGKVTIDVGAGTVIDSSLNTGSLGKAPSASMLPFAVQVDGFGGAGWLEGNGSAKFGGGLAFMLPIGSVVSVGPAIYGEHETAANVGASSSSSGGTTSGVRSFGTTGGSGGTTTSYFYSVSATAIFAGARVEGAVTDRFKIDVEAGAFPDWAKLKTLYEICGSSGCTTSGSSYPASHYQYVGWSVGVGGSFEVAHNVAVFARYSHEGLGASGNINSLNQVAFGLRFSIH